MAIYSYQCPDCDTVSDKVRSISEPEPTYVCNKCGSVLFRLYHSPGIQFNGSGFYSTDKSK